MRRPLDEDLLRRWLNPNHPRLPENRRAYELEVKAKAAEASGKHDLADKFWSDHEKAIRKTWKEEKQIMSLRKLKTHTQGDRSANVYRDSEYDEYRVKYYHKGKHLGEDSDSFHADADDAHSTARYELDRQNGGIYNALKEGYKPRPEDEQKFVAKHVIQKIKDANGNDDRLFKASNIKAIARKKERHGYEPGEDEKVYEAEQLDEWGYNKSGGGSWEHVIRSFVHGTHQQGQHTGRPVTIANPAKHRKRSDIDAASHSGHESRLYQDYTDGKALYLRGNKIAQKNDDGSIEVSNAHWPTNLTHSRLDHVARAAGVNVHFNSVKGNTHMGGKKIENGEWHMLKHPVNDPYNALKEQEILEEGRVGFESVMKAFAAGKKKRLKNDVSHGDELTYHGNTIARRDPDDSVHLSMVKHGSHPTTRQRFNALADHFGSNMRAYQEKHTVYVKPHGVSWEDKHLHHEVDHGDWFHVHGQTKDGVYDALKEDYLEEGMRIKRALVRLKQAGRKAKHIGAGLKAAAGDVAVAAGTVAGGALMAGKVGAVGAGIGLALAGARKGTFSSFKHGYDESKFNHETGVQRRNSERRWNEAKDRYTKPRPGKLKFNAMKAGTRTGLGEQIEEAKSLIRSHTLSDGHVVHVYRDPSLNEYYVEKHRHGEIVNSDKANSYQEVQAVIKRMLGEHIAMPLKFVLREDQ